VSDRPVDLISDNVDCVIRGGDLHRPVAGGAAHRHAPLVTVASPEYLRAHGTPKHPSDLEERHTSWSTTFPRAPAGRYPHVFEKDGESLESPAATSCR
jgi:LysR family transcriptional regulator for bpeEF and oprC